MMNNVTMLEDECLMAKNGFYAACLRKIDEVYKLTILK